MGTPITHRSVAGRREPVRRVMRTPRAPRSRTVAGSPDAERRGDRHAAVGRASIRPDVTATARQRLDAMETTKMQCQVVELRTGTVVTTLVRHSDQVITGRASSTLEQAP